MNRYFISMPGKWYILTLDDHGHYIVYATHKNGNLKIKVGERLNKSSSENENIPEEIDYFKMISIMHNYRI